MIYNLFFFLKKLIIYFWVFIIFYLNVVVCFFKLVKFVLLLKIKINEGNFFYILGRIVCLDLVMSKVLRDNVFFFVVDCDYR